MVFPSIYESFYGKKIKPKDVNSNYYCEPWYYSWKQDINQVSNGTVKDGVAEISVDVPGVPLEDISITYSKNILKIETSTENRKYTYEYSTPELDPSKIEAKLSLGVLSIKAPLKDKAPESHKVKVLPG